jgi:hypothetical protein
MNDSSGENIEKEKEKEEKNVVSIGSRGPL